VGVKSLIRLADGRKPEQFQYARKRARAIDGVH
jgi:hypothetical protein